MYCCKKDYSLYVNFTCETNQYKDVSSVSVFRGNEGIAYEDEVLKTGALHSSRGYQ